MQSYFLPRHSVFALVCSLTGLLPLAASAAPVQELVPADSFIVRHINTVPQLYQQISLDPVVRCRLARHFHTSAPAVTRYIQDNLVLTKLKKSDHYQVYCVGRSGQEYVINSRIAAGTPVFVLRATGQPVLKLACGNPMVASLPPVKTKVAAYHSLMTSPPAAPPAATAAVPPLKSSGPVVVAMTDTPGVIVMPTTKVGGFIGQLPMAHGGGGFSLGYLAGIPILAAIGSHGGGSPNTGTTSTRIPDTGTTGNLGTNTSGTNTLGTTGATGNTTGTTGQTTGTTDTNTLGTTGTTGNTEVTPVPEPGTPAAFAVGGAALLYLLGSARKRRTRRAG